MAAGITAAAYVLAALGKNSTMPASIVPFLVALLTLLLLAHVAMRFLAKGADSTLLPLAVLLNGLGYVMIARLSDERAAAQTVWTLVGIGAFVGTLFMVPRAADLVGRKWTFLSVGAGLLVLPLVPGLGTSVGGARIWVSLGPITFQPGEFAKVALALFFAAFLDETRAAFRSNDRRVGRLAIPDPKMLLPVGAAWAFAVAVMVAEKDLGSALLFFTLFTVMLWVATEQSFFLILGLTLFSVAAVLAHRLFAVVQTRVDNWIDPWSRYEGRGYQPAQAMFAFANGGTGGTGLGMGSPNKIPAASTDYIFAAIGEEMGIIGATAVLMAFVLLIGSGLRIAINTDRAFEKLLATGLTTILGMQAFIITGGVLRVIPLTGITLPFVSYGGSSLVANYVLLALLIRLSDTVAIRNLEMPTYVAPIERVQRWRQRASVGGAATVDVTAGATRT